MNSSRRKSDERARQSSDRIAYALSDNDTEPSEALDGDMVLDPSESYASSGSDVSDVHESSVSAGDTSCSPSASYNAERSIRGRCIAEVEHRNWSRRVSSSNSSVMSAEYSSDSIREVLRKYDTLDFYRLASNEDGCKTVMVSAEGRSNNGLRSFLARASSKPKYSSSKENPSKKEAHTDISSC